MSTAAESAERKSTFKVKIQRFGSFLSGMIMPNIGAFIAWGLITALFIPTGWLPNKHLAELVDPMIKYLLPLLIGYTGGKVVYAERGGVVGAAATMGVIVGSDVPMFLGAMIMGPLGGYCIKQVDRLFKDRIRQGFEMLVNNFSAGIVAGILACIAYYLIGPAVQGLSNALANGVDFLVHHHLIPLANIFIEPAKVLFLNNAIGNGILVPLGVEQSKNVGKSILFLLESNPGPGFGMLLAYWAFAKGTAKQSAPGAMIIQFLGGIHEIYFPYVLMRPLLIFAVMAGGVAGTLTFSIFNAGLTAAASPGSIFAILAMTPRGVNNYIGVIAGVLVAAAVSFILSALIIKTGKNKNEEGDLSAAAEKMQQMKGKKSSVASAFETKSTNPASISADNVDKIVFACDAGMGSSAMGASILRKKVNDNHLDIDVTNTSINNLPSDADIVVTHKDLTDRAKAKLPNAYHISVENFLASPKYDELINELKGDSEADTVEAVNEHVADDDYDNVSKIIFACDAGMGSSAMGASILRKKVKDAGLDIDVSNTAINNLPSDADIVVTHQDLTDRAKAKLPNAKHISVENFLSSPKYDELIKKLK
ncbi:PTS system mannitol-specific EIICB component [Pullulanibacillus camelliae]|uniref:PTS system mannitol-specific EIICB component n=1 Tax=Pullulanibacillus camelliae TaxID=1707096 RepID=A0A8J2YEW3_9BACL|nr:PTS mannitol-specific transporter subunit IIBC [Pullulanibacillus camelliae]GGE29671.1 PTS system mannitol-specific EIICB component [Pullulanibacillus camelliae]